LQQQGRLGRQQVTGVDGIDRLVLDLLDEFEPGLATPEAAQHRVGKRDLHEDQFRRHLGGAWQAAVAATTHARYEHASEALAEPSMTQPARFLPEDAVRPHR
jgi:hypothetical protein